MSSNPTAQDRDLVLSDRELQETEKALKKAWEKVEALCSGKERWTLRIPAQPDRDPDLVIADALTSADRLLAEVRRLRSLEQRQQQQIEALRSALERTESNFKAAVNGKPVRDMCETLAENRAAMEVEAVNGFPGRSNRTAHRYVESGSVTVAALEGEQQ